MTTISEVLAHQKILILPILGFGLVALFMAAVPRKWQKRSNVLLTWMWMIFFVIASGIVMLILFLFPFLQKGKQKPTQ